MNLNIILFWRPPGEHVENQPPLVKSKPRGPGLHLHRPTPTFKGIFPLGPRGQDPPTERASPTSVGHHPHRPLWRRHPLAPWQSSLNGWRTRNPGGFKKKGDLCWNLVGLVADVVFLKEFSVVFSWGFLFKNEVQWWCCRTLHNEASIVTWWDQRHDCNYDMLGLFLAPLKGQKMVCPLTYVCYHANKLCSLGILGMATKTNRVYSL